MRQGTEHLTVPQLRVDSETRRRSRLEVVKEVLEVCLNVPKRKEVIGQKANLNVGRLFGILESCRSGGLLSEVQMPGYTGLGYLTTREGKSWIQSYYTLVGMLNLQDCQIK